MVDYIDCIFLDVLFVISDALIRTSVDAFDLVSYQNKRRKKIKENKKRKRKRRKKKKTKREKQGKRDL